MMRPGALGLQYQGRAAAGLSASPQGAEVVLGGLENADIHHVSPQGHKTMINAHGGGIVGGQ